MKSTIAICMASEWDSNGFLKYTCTMYIQCTHTNDRVKSLYRIIIFHVDDTSFDQFLKIRKQNDLSVKPYRYKYMNSKRLNDRI